MANNPLQTTLCGVEMSSPIVLLSGCVGFGEEYTRVEGFSNRDVGAVVLKGTTGEMRLGNPPPLPWRRRAGTFRATFSNPKISLREP